ncbi:2-hydroxyacyl-CoA dehydratase family protein [Thermodesulfobacteriota bacterium]
MKRTVEREKIGFTTSIPIEVVYAAGKIPVDLNNIFINSNDASAHIDKAECAGFPRNMCSWIKGLYSVSLDNDINEVVGVIQGDCSNAQALLEVLKEMGVSTYFFSYPYNKDIDYIKLSIKDLMKHYGVGMKRVEKEKVRLDKIRKKVTRLDKMTYKDNLVTGFENHYFQVSCSDFNQDPDAFDDEVSAFIKEASHRDPMTEKVRLGYIGVPPIFSDLYDFIESHDTRVVYNEVQQQFSMPYKTDNIYDQYLKFTYPYDVFGRVDVIKREVKRRKLDGIVHYVQSFCFRQIEDLIIRRALDVPVLLVEGDRPAALDARTKLRIEVFLEMLKKLKE